MIQKLTAFGQSLMKTYLKPGMTVIDATIGNGYDALFIKSCIGESGKLIGFDIQSKAVETTHHRLQEEGFENFVLYQTDHRHLDDFIKDDTIDAVVYNLGYLPSGDHHVTTLAKSTIESLKKALDCLKPGGMLFVTAYPGHESGFEEALKVKDYLEALDSKRYHMMQCRYGNQPACAPMLFLTEKHF
jgi:ubiquinone/menaquinone biosynthesis C-methylase UbiE